MYIKNSPRVKKILVKLLAELESMSDEEICEMLDKLPVGEDISEYKEWIK